MVDAAIERGQPLPDWKLNEPGIQYGDEFYFIAFWDLSTCRSFGLEMGPIPWTATVQYAAYHDLDEELTRGFLQVMKAFDLEYLKWAKKGQERNGRLQNHNKNPGRKPSQEGR